MQTAIYKNNFLFVILIIVALEAILFSVGNHKYDLLLQNKENEIKKIQNIFSSVPIEAQALSIYDDTLGEKIYSKNDDLQMPLASLAKIMTVAIALNNYKKDDVVLVTPTAFKQEGDYGFYINEKFKVEDLAEITLIVSANDGAYALARGEDAFLDQMNEKARKIGAEKTLFFNFTGLDLNENLAGAYATAFDVNTMALYAMKRHEEIFKTSTIPLIKIKSLTGFNHDIKNTNIILDKIPNILFSKTGYTPLAGGNLTIIYKNKNGHDIAITLLGSTYEGRFSDMEKIIETLNNIN